MWDMDGLDERFDRADSKKSPLELENERLKKKIEGLEITISTLQSELSTLQSINFGH